MKKIITIIVLSINLLFIFNANGQCPEIWAFDAKGHNETYQTVVSCKHPEINLEVHYFFTASNFNGTYTVEPIAYQDYDTELCTPDNKLYLPCDDVFDNSVVHLPFDFNFFGELKQSAVVGANGMVTFNTAAQYCANGYNNTQYPLPWISDAPLHASLLGCTTYSSCNINIMRDAIYGIMSDTHPGILRPSYEESPHGIFKGVAGEYPCRYGFFIWDSVPMFNSRTKISNFYIKFYEGSNIIDVCIREYHKAITSVGIIGIQNATGQTQVSTKNNPNATYTDYIEPNSPGYFVAPGFNTFNGDTLYNTAFRFTPQGDVRVNLSWYEFNEDLSDSTLILSYTDYVQQGNISPTAYLLDHGGPSKNDTICVVSPNRPTFYKCWAKYVGANPNYRYSLSTSIFVDIDSANTTKLVSNDTIICHGQNAVINLEYPTTTDEFNHAQELEDASWEGVRVVNGQHITIDSTRYSFNENNSIMTLLPLPDNHIQENHIDTTIIYVQALYTNGCTNSDSITIITLPSFTVIYDTSICKGATFEFHNREYTTACTDSIIMQTAQGCDSIEILKLTISDVIHTTDSQKACNEYTWPCNNQTYTESTNTPTATLKNKYQCDSVVNLNLEIIPFIAKIKATPTHATLDNLNIMLSDISIGNDSCLWIFPDGSTSNSPIYNYVYPREYDSVQIGLEAISNLGCYDTTYSTISLLRESIWVPNIFCPTADAPNNKFAPQGVGLTYLNFIIFDRNGEIITEINGINNYWDGTTKDGRICPQDTYVYKITYRQIINPESTQIKTGTITLIR